MNDNTCPCLVGRRMLEDAEMKRKLEEAAAASGLHLINVEVGGHELILGKEDE